MPEFCNWSLDTLAPSTGSMCLLVMHSLLFSGEDVTSLYLSLAQQPEGCDHTPAQFVYNFNISYIPGVGTFATSTATMLFAAVYSTASFNLWTEQTLGVLSFCIFVCSEFTTTNKSAFITDFMLLCRGWPASWDDAACLWFIRICFSVLIFLSLFMYLSDHSVAGNACSIWIHILPIPSSVNPVCSVTVAASSLQPDWCGPDMQKRHHQQPGVRCLWRCCWAGAGHRSEGGGLCHRSAGNVEAVHSLD